MAYTITKLFISKEKDKDCLDSPMRLCYKLNSAKLDQKMQRMIWCLINR